MLLTGLGLRIFALTLSCNFLIFCKTVMKLFLAYWIVDHFSRWASSLAVKRSVYTPSEHLYSKRKLNGMGLGLDNILKITHHHQTTPTSIPLAIWLLCLRKEIFCSPCLTHSRFIYIWLDNCRNMKEFSSCCLEGSWGCDDWVVVLWVDGRSPTSVCKDCHWPWQDWWYKSILNLSQVVFLFFFLY